MDQSLLLWINNQWANPILDGLFVWVSSKEFFGLPMIAVIVALLGRQYGRDGLKLGVTFVLVIVAGDLLGAMLKHLIAQPRPCADLFDLLRHPGHTYTECTGSTSGMPSNHALNFFAAFAFLTYTTRSWRWGLPLLIIAVSVALSRMYLGAHYPSQVLAGTLLGLAVGTFIAWLGSRYFSYMTDIHATSHRERPA